MEKKFNKSKILILLVAIFAAILTFSVAIIGFFVSNKDTKHSEGAEGSATYGKYTYQYRSTSINVSYRYNGIAALTYYNNDLSVYSPEGLVLCYYLLKRGGTDGTSFNISNTSITLKKDLDMSGQPFLAIGTYEKPFKGTFDGDGFTISNLPFNNPVDYWGGAGISKIYMYGLLGVTNNSVVKDLHIKGININHGHGNGSSDVVGLIAAMPEGSLTITNCMVEGSVRINENANNNDGIKIGGLVGRLYGNITVNNCAVKVDIITEEFDILTSGSGVFIGGYIGWIEGYNANILIENSYYHGKFDMNHIYTSTEVGYVGGLIGQPRDNPYGSYSCVLKNNVVYFTEIRGRGNPSSATNSTPILYYVISRITPSSGSTNNRYYIQADYTDYSYSKTNVIKLTEKEVSYWKK